MDGQSSSVALIDHCDRTSMNTDHPDQYISSDTYIFSSPNASFGSTTQNHIVGQNFIYRYQMFMLNKQ